MKLRLVKKSQVDPSVIEWVSVGLSRLFGSRDGITNPVLLRSLFLQEKDVLARLGQLGMVRGKDWRITPGVGLEFPRNGKLYHNIRYREELKTLDNIYVRLHGEPRFTLRDPSFKGNEEQDGAGVRYVDFSDDRNYDSYTGLTFTRYPSSLTREETAVRRLFFDRFIDDARHVFHRNIDWSVGKPEKMDDGGVLYPIFYLNNDARITNNFELLVSKIDGETKNAVNNIRQNPEFAKALLGEHEYNEMGDVIGVSTLESLRKFLLEESTVFQNFDFSSLDDSDITELSRKLKEWEDGSQVTFDSLSLEKKEDRVRDILTETDVIPGFFPEFYSPFAPFTIFLKTLMRNRRLYDKFVELASKKGLKTPEFGSTVSLYEDLIAMNGTDPMAVDSAISEAYYNLNRSQGTLGQEEVGEILKGFVYSVFFEILRSLKNNLMFRPIVGNQEVSNAKRKEYNRFVGHISALLNQEINEPESRSPQIEMVVSSLFSDPSTSIGLVTRHPTVESLRTSPFAESVKHQLFEFVQIELANRP